MASGLIHKFCRRFKDWAKTNGVGLDNEDDWVPWWECFREGANSALILEIKTVECSYCGGVGEITDGENESLCPRCDGSGESFPELESV